MVRSVCILEIVYICNEPSRRQPQFWVLSAAIGCRYLQELLHSKALPRGRELLCQLSRCLPPHASTPLQHHQLHMDHLLPNRSIAGFPTLTNGNLCSLFSPGFPDSVVVKCKATLSTVRRKNVGVLEFEQMHYGCAIIMECVYWLDRLMNGPGEL